MSEDAHTVLGPNPRNAGPEPVATDSNTGRFEAVIPADDNLQVCMSAETTAGGGSTYVEFRHHPGASPSLQADKSREPQPRITRLPFRTRAGGPGVTIEALLLTAAYRLKQFQHGPSPCPENQRALGAIHQAVAALGERTGRMQPQPAESDGPET